MNKEIVTQVSIKATNSDWNPIYNSIQVGPQDEAGGSFLRIIGDDYQNEGAGASINLDWEEWDALVEVVAKYRKDWEWQV